MTFQAGQSGNPGGRPKGARGKAAIFAEGLFEGEAEEIIRKAVEMAKEGDTTAIRVCLDRIAPRRRDRAVPFELPALHSAESALSALADIAAAVSRGDLTRRPTVFRSSSIDICARSTTSSSING
jgi:hypothetical protein